MKQSRHTYLVTILTILLVMSGCRSHKKVMPADNNVPDQETIHVGKVGEMSRQLKEEALSWIGTPYKYAGYTKGEGTDCSGMVMKIYEDVTGIKLPRNSAKQAEFCELILTEKVKIGDLVFFATGKHSDKISHVGIVVDDGKFIHASSKGVVISDIQAPYYQRTFRMYGRVPGARL